MFREKRLSLAIFMLQLLYFGWAQRQTFRVTPQNTEAVAGDTVILACEVDHQQGQAQWTKDGYAFGYDRNITGFERYLMLGRERLGVHNLEIINVSLLDDGEFQCQVTPSGISGPLRHPANLTVLLAPVSIEMVGLPSHQTYRVNSGQEVTLECLVKDAKPAAGILWYRDGRRLRSESETTSKKPSPLQERRETTSSKITFTPTPRDNAIVYTCKANHSALTDREMKASVILDVQYEPGSPEILGFDEASVIRAGEIQTFTCRARGGNPLPEIYWYRNGLQIDRNYTKHKSYVENELKFNASASDNNATLECHVHNRMTKQPKIEQHTLQVSFLPSEPEIYAPSQVQINDTINITCIARNSNPPAKVVLVVNSQSLFTTSNTEPSEIGLGFDTETKLTRFRVPDNGQDLTVTCLASNEHFGQFQQHTKTVVVLRAPSPPTIVGYNDEVLKQGSKVSFSCVTKGGNPRPEIRWHKGSRLIKSESNPVLSSSQEGQNSYMGILEVLLEASDNKAEYSCEVSNDAIGVPLKTSIYLSVSFPPSTVKIKALTKVKAKTPVTLQCESSSSFPPSRLIWFKDGHDLNSGDYSNLTEDVLPGMFAGNVTRSNLTILPSLEDDGVKYSCQADNVNFQYKPAEAVVLAVLFPPTWKGGKPPPADVTVKEGEPLVIEVEAKGRPMPLAYKWKKEGVVVFEGRNFTIDAVNSSQGGKYIVEVSNTEGTTLKTVVVKIKYKPVMVDLPSTFNSSSNDIVLLICIFRGNPKPKLTWSREGYDFTNKVFELPEEKDKEEAKLMFNFTATRAEVGVFTCSAKNEIGEYASDVTVLVDHTPVFDESSPYQKAASDLGGVAQLRCRASAFPNPRFEWYTRENTPIEEEIYPLFNDRYKVEPPKLMDNLTTWESVLTVKDVSANDYGKFRCFASNYLGRPETSIQLQTTGKPYMPTNLKVLNATHESISLTWTPGFNGGLTQTYRIRYSLQGTKRYQTIDVYPERATLFTVSGLALGTIYSFSILAFNEKGSSSYTEDIIAATSSERPSTDVAVGESTISTTSTLSALFVVIIVLVAAALLALNIAVIACFFKRRAHSKRMASASSDKGSSKSATIEMYAPSSYTGTVNGETLSSISEKSRESYAHEESNDEYDAEASRVNAASTYLIEQLEPPPQYASRPAPRIMSPPTVLSDVTNAYDENIRRNHYNAALDRVTSYGTLGRRMPAADQYMGTSPSHYTQYNSHLHSIDVPNHTGSLRRQNGQQPKLSFPKDYIRNGTVSNSLSPSNRPAIPKGLQSPVNVGLTGGHSTALTTFAPEHGGRIHTSSLPLEQQGHLV